MNNGVRAVALLGIFAFISGSAPESRVTVLDRRAGEALLLRYDTCLDGAATRIARMIADQRLRYGPYAMSCAEERRAYVDAFVSINDPLRQWHEGAVRSSLYRTASSYADEQIEAHLPVLDPRPVQF